MLMSIKVKEINMLIRVIKIINRQLVSRITFNGGIIFKIKVSIKIINDMVASLRDIKIDKSEILINNTSSWQIELNSIKLNTIYINYIIFYRIIKGLVS